MGFLDILRGKRELKQPAPDRLFAMSTAQVAMQTGMGLNSTGKAAILSLEIVEVVEVKSF